jgi:hypothetical protein
MYPRQGPILQYRQSDFSQPARRSRTHSHATNRPTLQTKLKARRAPRHNCRSAADTYRAALASGYWSSFNAILLATRRMSADSRFPRCTETRRYAR